MYKSAIRACIAAWFGCFAPLSVTFAQPVHRLFEQGGAAGGVAAVHLLPDALTDALAEPARFIIDRFPLGAGDTVGPVTKRISAAYMDLVRGVDARHPEWRTLVYKPVHV